MNRYISRANLPTVLLSCGLGFVFLYAGIDALIQPLNWAGYLPGFLSAFIAPSLALKLIAIYEIVLALWLISGRYRKIASILAALTLAGIIVVNLREFFITFRDVGLLFAAVALYFMPTSKTPVSHES